MKIHLTVHSCTQLTPSYWLLKTTKPTGFTFTPGHSCMIHVPDAHTSNARAFTFVSRQEESFLQFLIKRSPDKESITHRLINAQEGQELYITSIFSTHHVTAPSTCIASGIGIAPFLAFARNYPDQARTSTLVWSVKKKEDIIYEDEVRSAYKQVIITLTQEHNSKYRQGRITSELLATLPLTNVQICGSHEFMKDIKKMLASLSHQS